jgi:homoserine O-acetyltransferase
LFDLHNGYGSLEAALARCQGLHFLLISFSSDWLFPAYQSLEIVNVLKNQGIHVSYKQIISSYGHDAFLLEVDELTVVIKNFLSAQYQRRG